MPSIETVNLGATTMMQTIHTNFTQASQHVQMGVRRRGTAASSVGVARWFSRRQQPSLAEMLAPYSR